jgi:predicted flap endonuclease-1-like 5' DNA nuclease
MATQQPFEPALRLDAERAFAASIGAASPLWFAFFGVAAGASTFWWMSKWARDLALDGASAATVDDCLAPFAAERVGADPVADAEAADLVFDPVAEAPVVVSPDIGASLIEPVEVAADDLTRLTGIGPKLALALAERGITRFAQIAAWTGKDLEEIDKALSLKGRAVRDAWVSQARRLMAN